MASKTRFSDSNVWLMWLLEQVSAGEITDCEFDDSQDSHEEPREDNHDSQSENSAESLDEDSNAGISDLYLGKDEMTKFRKVPLRRSKKAPMKNILSHFPGVKGCAKN
ncbi:hypothetical protein L798_14169 [Zootermopsis nevadensis]|uniref:Uncharacterized protein n=1 Tax=Zootermopsis nevadensis TaxID=136037 RepID=A0A067QZI8_ZOONE|nr:hypothetical protein L798_14169 [Zootermopsis nevadensis]